MKSYAEHTSQQSAIQRKNANQQNEQFFGGTEAQAVPFVANVQTKLSMGAPNDPYEQEADSMADEVVKNNGTTPDIQNKCASCNKEEEKVQRKPLFGRISSLVKNRLGGKKGKVAPKLQRMEEEENVQTKLAVQRMEEEPEEAAQAKLAVQRSEEEPEESIQTKLAVQRMEEEPEEAAQAKLAVQRSEEEPEESVQTKLAVQRMEEEPEEAAQAKLAVQRKEEEPEENVQAKLALQRMGEKDEEAQMKSVSTSTNSASPNIESSLASSKGKGSPMSAPVRSEMESNFGADFSQVKIHTDSASVDMNKGINAQAFTHGSDIYFNSGKYNPESNTGKHLLAHELTHTVQQGASGKIRKSEGVASSSESTGETIDFEAELAASNQEAVNSIDPSEARETRKEAESVLTEGTGRSDNAGGIDTGLPPIAPPPKRGKPQKEPDEDAEKMDQEEPEVGPVGAHLEKESANVCDDAAKKTQKMANNEQKHQTSSEKLGDSAAAVVPPTEEGQAQSNNEQVAVLDGKDKPTTNEVAAKAEMNADLDKAMPKKIKELNQFKEKSKAQVVGNKLLGEINKDVDAVKGTYEEIEQPLAPAPDEPTTEMPAVEEAPGTKKMNLGKEAVPQLQPEHTDMSHFDKESDDMLAKEEITQEQLDMVDTGDLAEANKERTQLKTDVQEQPKQVQEEAKTETKKVETDLQEEEKKGKQEMKAKRKSKLGNTRENQKATKSKIELKREAVTTKINTMFETTKKSVTKKLGDLEKISLKKFDVGQKIASQNFEVEVNHDINVWKKDRYSGFWGGAKWLKDKFFGIDHFKAVKDALNNGRSRYIKKIDQLILNISTDNNKVINDCKLEVLNTRKEIKKYVDSLGPELKSVGEKSLKEMQSKLDDLDGFVDKKKEELNQKLCDKKEEAIKKIDEKIEKMKEAMSGLISKIGNLILDAMIKFFKWALEKAGYSPDEIMGIINKGKAIIKKIVTDPIGFIMNIVTAVKNGIFGFQTNIKKYLMSGLVGWLTGAMGDIQISLPEKWDLKGIVGFGMDVLGVGWDIIRQKLAKHIPEKWISAAESSVDIVKRILKEGPIALWDMIKEKAGEIKQTVMEGIRNWVITSLVKQGIIKLVSFLNPAGAIVQAIMAIYNTIMFFVENKDRIVTFVKTVFGSIKDIALGKLGAASKAVESALGMTLPLIFNFLSRLIGLGGIGKAVKGVLMKVRKPIDKAVGKVVNFIVKKVKGLFGKGGKGKGKGKKDGKELDSDPKKAAKINAGLKAIDAQEKKYLSGEKISEENAKKVASEVKKKHKVFKSLKAVDGGETWDYIYEASPKKKKKGEKKSSSQIKKYTIKPSFTVYANNPSEFKSQIKNQEAGLNKMKVSDWKKNRNNFKKNGRAKDDLSDLRKRIRRDIADNYKRKNAKEFIKQNLSANQINAKAEKYAKTILTRNHAILHNPDQVAGGKAMLGELYKKGEITDEVSLKANKLVGHLGTNSSIGSQWAKQGRIEGLDNHVKKETKGLDAKKMSKMKMNVKLKYN